MAKIKDMVSKDKMIVVMNNLATEIDAEESQRINNMNVSPVELDLDKLERAMHGIILVPLQYQVLLSAHQFKLFVGAIADEFNKGGLTK